MTRLTALLRVFLVLLLLAGLGGCQSMGKLFGDKDQETETLPVEELYAEAKGSMEGKNYDRAARYYQRLVARFPYGAYSEQSQLELAYVLFKQGKTEEATSAVNRFIRTYPTHEHIDYAYYLKALINFDRSSSILLRVARQDMSARDLGAPTQSLTDFGDVVGRYPNSPYAEDSRQRMIYLRNLLAKHEYNVGLYYLRREAYVAAANRGKYLLQTYPQSEHDGDAVALMAAAYTGLGQDELAADARKVLEQNYPDHAYLTTSSWPEGQTLLNRLNPFDNPEK
jgi:outer membrane protein assembly factor BamD